MKYTTHFRNALLVVSLLLAAQLSPAQEGQVHGFGPPLPWGAASLPSDTITTPADVDGDGDEDLYLFPRSGVDQGKIFMMFADSDHFTAPVEWSSGFFLGDEVPAVGDFNGDGRADVAAVQQPISGAPGTVWVAASTGSGLGAIAEWSLGFAFQGETVRTGDVNGDGLADLVVFTRGLQADVLVSLSRRTNFDNPLIWHESFAPNFATPLVGDVNGDGKADAVAFHRQDPLNLRDVFVALSTGASFNGNSGAAAWHLDFADSQELPLLGDVNADGKMDLVKVDRENRLTNLSYSNGSSFGPVRLAQREAGVPGGMLAVGRFNSDLNADLAWAAPSVGPASVAVQVAMAGGHATFSSDLTGFLPPGNSMEAVGVRKVVIVLVQYTDVAAVLPAGMGSFWVNRIFGPNFPNVNDMYREMSNGLFLWDSGYKVGGNPAAFTQVGGAPLSYAEGTDRFNIAAKMKEAGFDFRPFDTNGDNQITPQELILLPVVNGVGGRNGQYAAVNSVVNYGGPNIAIHTGGAFCGYETDYFTAAHELCHALGAVDLYSAFTTAGHTNGRLTLMSEPDVHVDPLHRMFFNWTRPKVFDLKVPYPGGQRVSSPSRASAQQLPPLIFQDTSRNTPSVRQYFMVEARSASTPADKLHNPLNPVGGYDAQVPGSGACFWYLETKADGTPYVEDIIHPGPDFVLQSIPAGNDYLSAGAILGGADRTLATLRAGNDYVTSMYLVNASLRPADLLTRYGYAPALGLPGLYNQLPSATGLQPRWRTTDSDLPVGFRVLSAADGTTIMEWGVPVGSGSNFAPWISRLQASEGIKPGCPVRVFGQLGAAILHPEVQVQGPAGLIFPPSQRNFVDDFVTFSIPQGLPSGSWPLSFKHRDANPMSNARYLTVNNPYLDWIWASVGELGPRTTDPAADFDGDGVKNAVEYALDTDPGDAASGPDAFGISLATTGATFVWRQRIDRVMEVNLTMQTSTDLVSWFPAGSTSFVDNGTSVTWRYTRPAPQLRREFYRLRAELLK